MDQTRKDAYAFLLSAALLHVKWDLAGTLGGFPWSNPFHWRHFFRAVDIAGARAFLFHNLAIFLARDMQGFREERFWEDVERFRARYPTDPRPDYRRLFEKKLNREEVDVMTLG